MPRAYKFFSAYLVLLCASHIYEYAVTPEPAKVHIDYRDTKTKDKPVILLLHGSPVGASLFEPLIRRLDGNFRVIAPSLPGFEKSTREIPDYSIRAHAVYMRDFIRELGLGPVHVVGYSMGSGVAIELARLSPQSLVSLTLLSGIGAQEFELLGNYHLNHVLHGVQLGLIWLLGQAIPHFGRFRDFPLNYYYARNFYDTDQRPLKKYLSEVNVPTLILHGADDLLVPAAAAQKHHQLIPQSKLKIFPGEGHLLAWEKPADVAAAIQFFLTGLDEEALEKPSAGRLRIQKIALQSNAVPPVTGGAFWFLLLLIALATFASEDLAALSSGFLVANGNIPFWSAVLASFVGIFAGDILIVLTGRFLSSSAMVMRLIGRIGGEEKLQRASAWLDKRGFLAILISRFVPGTRVPLYLTVGLTRRSLLGFSAAFCAASLAWTPLIVGAGYFFGEQALQYLERYNGSGFLLLLLVIGFYMVTRRLPPLLTWKGRRLLYSSWLRATRWEFWPPYLFYIPVGFYFIWLSVRYRSFTVFTAANPAIPAGGIIGESKAEILRNLAGAGRAIARFTLLKSGTVGDRLKSLSDFMRRHKLRYPVVLKPDAGERGNDVQVIRSAGEAAKYLERHDMPAIAQEYIPGLEFGVFYFRYPRAPRGEIFAITDKRFPALKGDGQSTLEELILRDGRAVTMARFHLGKYESRLEEIPLAGKAFALVELGTHCKGSLFLEGSHLATPELTQEIERISRSFDGFYFGRYDIRVPSLEDFRRGKNLKVIELNGVTSEATSIYDPKYSVFHAWRVLARQWRIAFEIGRQNTERGARPTPISSLVRLILSGGRE